MNAKEKAIIEAIIDKNNERKHDRALKLLLFGEEKGGSFSKNEYANLLKDLVKKKYARCFSFEDTYNTFATGFWMHLDKMTPEQLRSINDLKAWLFEVAKNYIESIRDIIEALQPNGLTNDDPGNYSEETTPFDETESDKLERLDYAK